MENLLLLSIEAALRAGEAVMQVYNISFEVFVKEDQSPVTQADLKASDIIKQTLAETGLPFCQRGGFASRPFLFQKILAR